MSDINWDEAPEGATHYAQETMVNKACWINDFDSVIRYVTVDEYNKRPSHFVWLLGSVDEDDDRVTKRPVKPVYTQAMCDAGTLPSVGSKVQYIGNDDYLVEFDISDGDELTCLVHTKDFEGESIGVYRHKSGFSVSILNQLIKPIDTRTDEEKAFDNYWSNLKDCNDVVEFKEAVKLSFVAGLNYNWGI